MRDARIVYGARCMWWGSIDESATAGSGLPVTPCCGSPMFEVESEAEWWAQVDAHEERTGTRGYRQFIEWLRGRCYPTPDAALQAFYEAGHTMDSPR